MSKLTQREKSLYTNDTLLKLRRELGGGVPVSNAELIEQVINSLNGFITATDYRTKAGKLKEQAIQAGGVYVSLAEQSLVANK